MPSDVSRISDVIWNEIALYCGVGDIKALEATCKFIGNVLSNKVLWLKQLRALDQDRAPNLPRHISIDKLYWHEVRTLVVRAHQRRLNCTGSAPLRPTRKITVDIGSASFNGALGKSYDFQTDVELLPGGRLLLVLWSEGYLQCWDVPGGKCLWTYPDPASSDKHDLRVRGFCYEMQADNVVHIVTKSLCLDLNRYKSSFEIFRISAETKEPEPLYKYPEQYPHVSFGWSFMKLHGGISVVWTEFSIFLTFWKERRTVEIEGYFDTIDMIGDYLICMVREAGGRSVVVILLSSIRKALPDVGATTTLVLDDLPYTKCPVPSKPDWNNCSAEISSCDFHWKSEAERKRKGINITVLRNLQSRATRHDFSVVNSFLLETAPGTASMSRSRFPFPNDSLPRLTHIGDSQLIDPQFGKNRYFMYHHIKRLSQAGSTMAGYKESCYPNSPSFVWMLATSCGKEVVLRKLELPRVKSVGMEFYSGAVYFPTMDAKSVVIQYFD